MKRLLRNALILLTPFLIMALINEAVRPKIKEKPYKAYGITAINSAEYLPNKCTWICHNNTTYCKAHHVKYLKPFYSITDVFYFGAIGILASTGNYGAANIIFLVFLFPLTILYFIIKSIDIQEEIQKLSKQKL
jgi:hypothetical protein